MQFPRNLSGKELANALALRPPRLRVLCVLLVAGRIVRFSMLVVVAKHSSNESVIRPCTQATDYASVDGGAVIAMWLRMRQSVPRRELPGDGLRDGAETQTAAEEEIRACLVYCLRKRVDDKSGRFFAKRLSNCSLENKIASGMAIG